MPRRLRRLASALPLWPIAALAALLAYNALFTTGFFQIELRDGHFYGSLIDILEFAAPVMLTALGMTLVIATGGIDLSVGAIFAISGALAAHLLDAGNPLLCAVLAALGASLALGVWNGCLVAFGGMQPFVATLVLMVAGRGIALLISAGQTIPIHNDAFNFLGSGYFGGIPMAVSLALVTWVLLAGLTRRTALGLFLESTGNNAEAARLAGVPTARIRLFAYATCGLLAGLAGLLKAADLARADANTAGLNLELDAILAVVLGGTALTGGRFSLAGSIVGALVLQTLTDTILRAGVPMNYTLVVRAIVVLAVCLLQSPTARQHLSLTALRRRRSAT